MARRIEIELTSARDDGQWTWRAAGAREPKGLIGTALVPDGSAVGTVLRVEVEVGLDGTEVTSVLPPKGERTGAELLELIGRDLRDDELVTSKLVGKRGRRDDDGDRRGRRGRDGGPGRDGRRGGPGGPGGAGGRGRPDGQRGRDGGRGPRPDGEGRGPRPERSDRSDRQRRRPPADAKPRPKRLRPQRTHRRAVLDTLEAHERPIADEVLRGGIPAVRQAVEKQNQAARAEGRPEVDPAQLEALAELLLPRLRTAEWRDRADAALAEIDELDLRDLRTVVVAADSAAKDDESRAIAAQLREGLDRRIEADQAAWLAELDELLTEGRVVRALRVSSRPPKAGAPLPAELLNRLAEGATASLTADTFTDRWVTVLDALALSPVHARVAPASVPEAPSDELKTAVAAAGTRVPLVAAALGVEPAAPKRGPRRPPRGGRPGGPAGGRGPAPKGGPAPKAETPPPPPAAPEAAPAAPPVVEADAAPEAPAPETEAAPAAEAPPVDDAVVGSEATPEPAPAEAAPPADAAPVEAPVDNAAPAAPEADDAS